VSIATFQFRHAALIAAPLALTALVAACGGLAFTVANAPAALAGGFDRRADLSYGTHERHQLDVYVPDGEMRDRPVVVFWYGGAWTQGSKEQYRFVGAALAREGFVAVLPDYRLHPSVKFPAFVEDGALALRYVREHAHEWGGDPQRLYLMGHSAGAHLAAMLAFDGRYLARVGGSADWIDGLIGLSGPYALEPNSATLNAIFDAPYTPEDWQPVRYVDRAAPATLLLHGADDAVVTVRHTLRLAQALRETGVAVEERIYEGRGHADTVAALSLPARRRAPVLADVRRFIERQDFAKRSVARISSCVMPASKAEWPASGTMRRSDSGQARCRSQALRSGQTTS
jgi:acetyl esterase/lipase